MALMNTVTFEMLHSVSVPGYSAALVKIDEEIAPVIRMLNERGYTTKYSCSGHLYPSLTEILTTRDAMSAAADTHLTREIDDNTVGFPGIMSNAEMYVVFDRRYGFGTDIPLPEGFVRFDMDGEDVIRHAMTIDDAYSFFRQRLDASEKLFDWARSLPNIRAGMSC